MPPSVLDERVAGREPVSGRRHARRKRRRRRLEVMIVVLVVEVAVDPGVQACEQREKECQCYVIL